MIIYCTYDLGTIFQICYDVIFGPTNPRRLFSQFCRTVYGSHDRSTYSRWKKESFSKLTTKAKDRKWIPQWQSQCRAFHGEVRDMEAMESSVGYRVAALESRLSESETAVRTGSSQAPPPPKRLHVIKNIVGCRRPECYREKRRIMGHHYNHHRKCHRGWSAAFWVPQKSGELRNRVGKMFSTSSSLVDTRNRDKRWEKSSPCHLMLWKHMVISTFSWLRSLSSKDMISSEGAAPKVKVCQGAMG